MVLLVPSQYPAQLKSTVRQRDNIVGVQLAGVHVVPVVAILDRKPHQGVHPVVREHRMEDRLPALLLHVKLKGDFGSNYAIGERAASPKTRRSDWSKSAASAAAHAADWLRARVGAVQV